MINFGHAFRVASSIIREGFKTISRSGGWPSARRKHLATHPVCAACGGNSHPQVHHIEPFHLDPSLELNPTNFITLCMGEFECHLRLGHGDDFKAFNPTIVQDAALVLANPQQRPLVEAKAKNGRRYTEYNEGADE